MSYMQHFYIYSGNCGNIAWETPALWERHCFADEWQWNYLHSWPFNSLLLRDPPQKTPRFQEICEICEICDLRRAQLAQFPTVILSSKHKIHIVLNFTASMKSPWNPWSWFVFGFDLLDQWEQLNIRSIRCLLWLWFLTQDIGRMTTSVANESGEKDDCHLARW